MISGTKHKVGKLEVFRAENAHAANLEDELKNDEFGFAVLHYSISEASGSLRIKVLNKRPDQDEAKVRVKTYDREAVDGQDYRGID